MEMRRRGGNGNPSGEDLVMADLGETRGWLASPNLVRARDIRDTRIWMRITSWLHWLEGRDETMWLWLAALRQDLISSMIRVRLLLTHNLGVFFFPESCQSGWARWLGGTGGSKFQESQRISEQEIDFVKPSTWFCRTANQGLVSHNDQRRAQVNLSCIAAH